MVQLRGMLSALNARLPQADSDGHDGHSEPLPEYVE